MNDRILQHEHDHIACPRCGYDLRGAVSAWTNECPLDGTCTECGLSFNWSHVLMIGKYEPRWCVEFAPSWRNAPLASMSTLLRSFRPWRFWRSMNMSSRVRWRRLGAYLLILFSIVMLPYVAVQATRAIIVRRAHDQLIVERVQTLPADIAQMEAQLRGLKDGTFVPGYGDMPKEQQIAQSEFWIKEMKANLATPPAIEHSYFVAIIEAIVNPFGTTSWGTVRTHDGRLWPYPSPSEYQEFLAYLPVSAGTAPGAWWTPSTFIDWQDVKAIIADFAVVVALALLLPASFVLLPASRRRAKVRWRHIGRIGAYSLAFPAIIATVLVAAIGLMSIPHTMGWVPTLIWQLPISLWLLLPLWWWAAIKHYLRMPHAFAVAFLMTLMIALFFAPMWIAGVPYWFERMLIF